MAQSDISPEPFEYLPEASAMVGGAHRRPPIPIGTPAVTQHLGFWIPDDYLDKREQWVEQAEKFILGVYDKLLARVTEGTDPPPETASLRSENGTPRLFIFDKSYAKNVAGAWEGKVIERPPERYRTTHLSFFWETMPVELGFELHNEYFTLSASLDFSQWKPGASDKEEPNAAKLTEAIAAFNRIASERYNKLKDEKTPTETEDLEDRNRFKEIYNFLHYEIWQRMHDALFAKAFGAVRTDNLGYVFSDFRGFQATRGDGKDFIVLPGSAPVEPPDKKLPFEEGDGVLCVKTMLPFLMVRAGEPPGPGKRPQLMEYSFSPILGGHALHASALGAVPSTVRDSARMLVHTHMVLDRRGDRQQLGRLVDRGNTLGALRLAALRDLQKIVDANKELRKIDAEIKKINLLMPQTLEEDKRDAAVKNITASLHKISESMAEVGKDIQGGLPHRVRQSHYYLEQFWDAVDDLRIEGRIEGYQTYQEFVRRRLGGTFRFIQGVGERYVRVEQTVAAINQQLNTVQELQMQKRVEEVTRDGAFLLLIPLTYYIASLALKRFDKHPQILKDNPWLDDAILVCSFLLSAGAINYRRLVRAFKNSAKLITQKTQTFKKHIQYRIYVSRSKLQKIRRRGHDRAKTIRNWISNTKSAKKVRYKWQRGARIMRSLRAKLPFRRDSSSDLSGP